MFYRRPSVHKTLIDWNWKRSKVSQFTKNLNNEIKAHNIQIISTNIDLHDENLDKNYPDFQRLCIEYCVPFANRKRRYPYDSEEFGKLHDFAAIYYVMKYRNNKPVDINDPKAFFLTSDRQLTRFNQIDMYREQEDLPEVILDTGFASMLWFLYKGRGETKFSIELIISAYTNNEFIGEKAWRRYREVLSNMIKNDEINIAHLPHFYLKNLYRDLSEIPKGQEDYIINSDFIEKGIRESQKEEKNLVSQLKKAEQRQIEIEYKASDENTKLKEQLTTIVRSGKKWKYGFFLLLIAFIIILLIFLLCN